jgi:hypothetical protein
VSNDPGDVRFAAVSEHDRNVGTVFRPGSAAYRSFKTAFSRVFPQLDPVYRSLRTDGVLIAAVIAGGELDRYLHIPVSLQPEFAIGGRHSQCDLLLAHDASVSLRHVAFAAARQGVDEVRIRVIDLQTGIALRTEEGNAVEALIAEGPLFISVGDYQLFLLPTGSLARTLWGHSAEETWSTFPERVYLDRRIPPLGGSGLHPLLSDGPERRTITRIVSPPQPLGRRALPGDAGERVGKLELVAGQQKGAFTIHARDVARGILIGRYERCSLGIPDESLSRVHALIIEHDGKIWVVDTASTYGIFHNGERVRQVRLDAATSVGLAGGIRLTWTRSSSRSP